MSFYLSIASAIAWGISSFFWIRSAIQKAPVRVVGSSGEFRLSTDGNNVIGGLAPDTPEQIAAYLKGQSINNTWAAIISAAAALLAAVAILMQQPL